MSKAVSSMVAVLIGSDVSSPRRSCSLDANSIHKRRVEYQKHYWLEFGIIAG
jgi:hypothetical protein